MSRRAATDEAREDRRAALLDAAMQVWLEHPDRITSVAEVAQAAGVAKGTLYLYFESKENMLLAAHERQKEAFFAALIDRAGQPAQMTFDDMMALTRRHIVEVPAFLPLATLVAGLLHKGVTPKAAAAFEQRMAERLGRAGELLCGHFAFADAAAGVRLLMQSYGLILGLWQLLGNSSCLSANVAANAMLHPDYATELDTALRALWRGTLNNKEIPDA
jgi:AcrR family transcriptional regulator